MAFDRPVYALVAAAGSGTRLGFSTPKAFVELAGRSLLERSLDALAESGCIDHAIVLVSADMRAAAEDLLARTDNVAAWGPMSTSVCLGGGERVDSVFAGLEELERRGVAAGSLVAVHDAARCLIPADMVRQVVDRAGRGVETGAWDGAVPVLPVTDTIKIVDHASSGPADGALLVEQTPARHTLRAAVTPQVFNVETLLEANRQYFDTVEIASAHPTGTAGGNPVPMATDDSSIMELAGKRVLAVDADPLAMKITTPQDYRIAEMLVGARGGVENKDAEGAESAESTQSKGETADGQ